MKYNNILSEIFKSIMSAIAGIIIYVSNAGYENYGIVIIQTALLSYFADGEN